MSLAGFVAPSAVLLLLVLCAPPPCHGAWSHNITGVLAAYPEFSAFSAALTATGVAAEVDSRTTITVLAVDDAAMAEAQAQGLQPEELRRAVSLHVLLDYFDDAKLRGLQGGFAQAASLFQASGKAPGSAGIVNITAKYQQGGRVEFAAEGGAPAPAVFVYEKSVVTSPYDIAVLKVSALISSSPAPAQAPGTSASRFTDLLSKNGCGGFAALFAALADAKDAYDRIGGGSGAGLTVFCPSDEAVSAFGPAFKNLTADAKVSLLLYHGVAAHHTMQSLRAINGAVSTLAAGGGSKKGSDYNLTVRADGDAVKLSSAAPAPATVTRPLMDKGAVAVYLIDGVLLPRELFNSSSQGGTAAPSPAPASAPTTPAPATAPATTPTPAAPATAPAPPAPAPVVAPATAPIPRRRPTDPEPEMRSPAPSPDEEDTTPADQKNSGARGKASWTLGAAVAAAVPAMIVLVL